MAQVRNYGRFYAALSSMPCPYGKDELKRQLVSEFTGGRTESLREMTDAELGSCCAAMEAQTEWREKLKRARSLSLRLMQKIGVDTTDWNRINAFCRDARIAGCEFSRITCAGHLSLQRKLRAIDKNGGLQPRHPAEEKKTRKNNPLNISILCIPTMTTSNSSRLQ